MSSKARNDIERERVIREAQELMKEVGEGKVKEPESAVVKLARQICDIGQARRQPIAKALAAISEARSLGATKEERSAAARPHMDQVHAANTEIDNIIEQLGQLERQVA